VRPIARSDAPALVRFHELLSPESQRTRFFAPHPHLSEKEVEHFTHVDHLDREALVATEGTEIVAVGRYERLPGTDQAEVAFVTRDDHHGSGLAAMLLDQLAIVARRVGISVFIAQTLVGNWRMLGVFNRSRFPVSTTSRDGIVDVTFSIAT
jgi:GNAT superfamily N-acetyltransferase